MEFDNAVYILVVNIVGYDRHFVCYLSSPDSILPSLPVSTRTRTHLHTYHVFITRLLFNSALGGVYIVGNDRVLVSRQRHHAKAPAFCAEAWYRCTDVYGHIQMDYFTVHKHAHESYDYIIMKSLLIVLYSWKPCVIISPSQ